MATYDYAGIYYKWRTSALAKVPKHRRFNFIHSLIGSLAQNSKVLEVGYGSGADYIHFLPESVDAWGIDLLSLPVDRPNFHSVKGDACDLPFQDKSFDVAVSIGVYEHISPIEKLCKAITEIRRASKCYCVIVLCVATPF